MTRALKAGKLLGPILVAAVQTTAEQILQSFVVPGGVYVPMAPIPPANVVPIATPPPYGFVLVTVYEARGVFGRVLSNSCRAIGSDLRAPRVAIG
eukprot:Skav213653  [mRNA]  locus=scaffold2012:396903:399533:- [translate_table: standard]